MDIRKLVRISDSSSSSSKTYSKDELLEKVPVWVKDIDAWEKVVNKVTHEGEKEVPIVVALKLYKKAKGGTSAVKDSSDSYEDLLKRLEGGKRIYNNKHDDEFVFIPQSKDDLNDIKGIVYPDQNKWERVVEMFGDGDIENKADFFAYGYADGSFGIFGETPFLSDMGLLTILSEDLIDLEDYSDETEKVEDSFDSYDALLEVVKKGGKVYNEKDSKEYIFIPRSKKDLKDAEGVIYPEDSIWPKVVKTYGDGSIEKKADFYVYSEDVGNFGKFGETVFINEDGTLTKADESIVDYGKFVPEDKL